MKRIFRNPRLLWLAAFLLTIGSALYQRWSGPSYPVSGRMQTDGGEITWRLPRTWSTSSDAEIRVNSPDFEVAGFVEWKRYKTGEPFTRWMMDRVHPDLVFHLQRQPAAGKVIYRAGVIYAGQEILLNYGEPVVLRFKGDVPSGILIVHVIAMFTGMLLSTRAGLEAITATPRYGSLLFLTIFLLGVGGLIFGPIVQKYAFGAYWTGWPFGSDLTDNKTVVAVALWAVAAWSQRFSKRPHAWIAAAAMLTFVVFLIPHSVLGSELDYSKLPK
jgi:hypothetical protein